MATEIHKGYVVVRLTPDNENCRKWFAVHQLLAMTFIPNPNGYTVVNHKNRNRLDDSLENLEWCTVQENNYHTKTVGKRMSGKPCSLYKGDCKIKDFTSVIEAATYAASHYNPVQVSALLQRHQAEDANGQLLKIVRHGLDTRI